MSTPTPSEELARINAWLDDVINGNVDANQLQVRAASILSGNLQTQLRVDNDDEDLGGPSDEEITRIIAEYESQE